MVRCNMFSKKDFKLEHTVYNINKPELGERALEATGSTPPGGLLRTAAHPTDMLRR